MAEIIPLFRKSGVKVECIHSEVSVDDDDKTVTCRQCGKIVDPFYFLTTFMTQFDRLNVELDRANRANKAISHENNKLRRKLYPGK